jgi:hypothetical protein
MQKEWQRPALPGRPGKDLDYGANSLLEACATCDAKEG